MSEVQLRRWARTGKVRFVPSGPSGAMLALRMQLDEALVELFVGSMTDVSEDLDFG
jgi:hypothetical protein